MVLIETCSNKFDIIQCRTKHFCFEKGAKVQCDRDGTILKIQASRWSKIALEIDIKKRKVVMKKKNIIKIQFLKRSFLKKLLGGGVRAKPCYWA